MKPLIDFIRDESPEKTNQNYGNLYFHSTNRKDPSKLYHWSQNRVDLCLSEQNDVYFSLLLKRALVKDQERKENQVIDSTKFMYQKESQLASKVLNLFGLHGYVCKVKERESQKDVLTIEKERINFPKKIDSKKYSEEGMAIMVNYFVCDDDGNVFHHKPNSSHTWHHEPYSNNKNLTIKAGRYIEKE